MDRCLIMFIAGIGIGLYATQPVNAYWAIGTVLFAALILAAKVKPQWPASAIICIFCGIAVSTANLNWQQQQSNQLQQWADDTWLTVDIVKPPQPFSSHTRLLVEPIDLANSLSLPPWQTAKLRLSWYGDAPAGGLKLGQRWRLKVKLKAAKNYWNEGSQDFVMRMRRQHIIALGSVQQGQLVGSASAPRARLIQRFHHADTPAMNILAALSVGSRHLLTPQQQRQWQQNGLAHALAISGLHLSLVAWGALLISRQLVNRLLVWRLPQHRLEQLNGHLISLLVALAVAYAYAALADFAIATVRALLMLTVVVIHQVLALRVTAWQVLLRAVALLLFIDPLAWLDLGFWLSISALVIIITTLWRWQQQPKGYAWLGLIRLQLMFLIAMAPLSLHWFGGVSLWSPVINLVVLPVISTWVLPLNLLATAAELSFSYQFADNLWYLAGLPLQWLQPLLAWTAEQSTNWWQPQQPVSVMILLLVIALALLPLAKRWCKLVLLLVLPLTATAWQWSRERDPELVLHLLDVGQSQAVVLERRGRAVLVDTGVGYASGYSMAAAVVEPFLRHRNLALEQVWISHSDADHSGGLDYLRQRYPAIDYRGALTANPCQQGQSGRWNDIEWQVIWPPKKRRHSGNNQSCVLHVSFDDFTILLPGDIEFSAERAIAESVGFAAADILVAPHHGSRTSSGWLLLKQVQPSVIIISNGEHKGFQFPSSTTTRRYQQMQRLWLNTKDVGQISIRSDGQSWELATPMMAKRQRRLYQLDD